MKYVRVIFALAMVPLVIGGCVVPQPSANNSVTLHNDGETNITYFAVSRIDSLNDVSRRDHGINILERELAPGQSFTVGGLVDGRYQLYCLYQYYKRSDVDLSRFSAQSNISTKRLMQSIEGGKHYDWHFTANSGHTPKPRLRRWRNDLPNTPTGTGREPLGEWHRQLGRLVDPKDLPEKYKRIQ